MGLMVNNKYIDMAGIAWRFTQGENNADVYEIYAQRYDDTGTDLLALSWSMVGSHVEYGTLVASAVSVSGDKANGNVVFAWKVSSDFTACDGALDLCLQGSDSSGNVVIKYRSSGVLVAPTLSGNLDAPQSVIEQALAQIALALPQCAAAIESAKAAAASATAAKSSETTATQKAKEAAASAASAADSVATAKAHISDTVRHITAGERTRWNDTYTKSETAARDKAVQDDLNSFKARRDNPNMVTKAQVGLGNATNESKATMFASPTFTGTVTLPAAAPTADTQAAHKGYVDKKVAGLVGTAPGALDTLNELAAALGDDPNFATTLATQIGGKVDKITGKGLSTHDYDATEKAANTANTAARHTHGNKALLDGYTQTEVNLKSAVDQRHSHANKSVLDGLTAALVTAWNGAVSHIADAVKHITAAERTLWNTVSGKVDKVSGKGLSTEDYTSAEKKKLADVAAGANNYVLPLVQVGGTSTTSVMSQKAVTDAIGAAGGGDMMKNVYDANGNGKVDIAENAEKVNWLTVQTAVPQGAKFTDTVYVHPATHPASMVTGLPTSLPANGGTSAACSGNAATATKLQIPRTINGVSFDGTANITVTATTATTAQNIDGGTY